MTKIHRQDPTPTSHPPRNGPTAPEMPASPDQAPMAFDRSSSRKLAWRIASAPGVRRAAPTPWRARAAMSVPISGATAQTRDASPNHVVPTRKTRRRPKRSPSVPPTRTNAARVSVYALTVHVSWATPAPRSPPIAGRAMLTTVASRNAIEEPRTVAASTQRPRESPYARDAGAAGTEALVTARTRPRRVRLAERSSS